MELNPNANKTRASIILVSNQPNLHFLPHDFFFFFTIYFLIGCKIEIKFSEKIMLVEGIMIELFKEGVFPVLQKI